MADVPSVSVDDLKAYCRSNGRVCPLPKRWNDIWKSLPRRQQLPNGGWQPPVPLVLGAWYHASNNEKAERLVQHIDWAAQHGCLQEVDAKLRSLPERDWHHMTD